MAVLLARFGTKSFTLIPNGKPIFSPHEFKVNNPLLLCEVSVQGLTGTLTQARMSSFPKWVDVEAKDVRWSVEHAHCVSQE